MNSFHKPLQAISKLARGLVIFLIRLYRWTLSPLKNAVLGPAGCCRFSPTCSQYAVDAVTRFGVMRGGVLTLKRVCRCHPWGGCGEDPVPGAKPREALFNDTERGSVPGALRSFLSR